ncbi:hypothetical protein [Novosphingobium rosa]|uniref:hypothetical protein n=1 Tax=Novosphingobium rosa TaxID=76978 RepID=UPI000ADE4B23|nr:hypothetical protein [Novosphingobium rosa]
MNRSTFARALMACSAGALLLAQPVSAREELTGEQQLTKLLGNRVPGKPVSCINLMDATNTTIIDKTAIVYSAGAGVYYVNRPQWPEQLDDDSILVTKTWGSQLCRLDMVQLHDRSGGFWRGTVGLNDFVPYRMPPKDKAAKHG